MSERMDWIKRFKNMNKSLSLRECLDAYDRYSYRNTPEEAFEEMFDKDRIIKKLKLRVKELEEELEKEKCSNHMPFA